MKPMISPILIKWKPKYFNFKNKFKVKNIKKMEQLVRKE